MKPYSQLLPVLLSAIMIASCGKSGNSETNTISTFSSAKTAATVTGIPAPAETTAPTETKAVSKTVNETETSAETPISDTVTKEIATHTDLPTKAETIRPETLPPTKTFTMTEKITSETVSKTMPATKAQEQPAPAKIKGKTASEVYKELTLREKVGQLFITSPYLLTKGTSGANMYKNAFQRIPLGGIAVYGFEVQTPSQILTLTNSLQDASKVPLITALDEEGGRVARIGNAGTFPVTKIPSMQDIGLTGDPEQAYNAGKTIGKYIRQYGFNTDFAPVADINSNPQNTVIGNRSFGSDPNEVSAFVGRCIDGLHESNAMSCLKHFPGHGDTAEDTHYSAATVNKTWEELKQCELIPFIENLDKTDMIMIAHITLPKVTGDHTPASLSYEIMTNRLRNELGFSGVIITDALAMNAVKNYYSSGDAAVKSFMAGADILLIPDDIDAAYNAVLKAIEAGEIPMSRLEDSVMRILSFKEKYGLLG